MSRTARENALQEPDVWGTGRMSGGPDVRGGRCPGLRAGCPGSKSEDELEELDFGAEIDDFGGKIAEISWMESGQNWGKDRSTSNKLNPWIKSNKTSSHQQITTKLG